MSRNWSHLVRKRENLEVLFLILPFLSFCCCSVAKSCLTLQHVRPPCPSPPPRVCPNSHPLNQWRHPTFSSSLTCFSFSLQSFPASGFFPTSQLFASGGQSIGVSTSAFYPSILPTNSKFKLYFLPPSVTTSRTIFLTLNWKMLVLIFFSGRTHKATNPSC